MVRGGGEESQTVRTRGLLLGEVVLLVVDGGVGHDGEEGAGGACGADSGYAGFIARSLGALWVDKP